MNPYEIAVLAEAELLSLWPLAETEGTTASDAAGEEDGEYIGSPTLGGGSLLPNGEGASVGLNGSSQYIKLPNDGSLVVGGNFTFECWVEFEVVGEEKYQTLFSGGENGAPIFYVDPDGKLTFDAKNVFAILATGEGAVEAGVAYHIALTNSAGGAKIYLNGNPIAETVTAFPFGEEAFDWYIGKNGTENSAYLGGSIQYAALYGAELTGEKIGEHFEAGEAEGEEEGGAVKVLTGEEFAAATRRVKTSGGWVVA